MANYTVYKGKFICHECKKEVLSLRCYPDTKELTWMCPEKHVSRVTLGKRKKGSFEREE
jgi:hypothetical protein